MLIASTAAPAQAHVAVPMAAPACSHSRAKPISTARLESSGLMAGSQYTSAALSAPKPRPIKPASKAMGAISRSCSTAKACNSGSSPGPTRVIKGLASSTSSNVTTSNPRPTKVLMAASSWALSCRSRLAMTLTMAL